MAEAIQNVIDDWLIEKFTASMGSGSAYSDNKLSTIRTAIIRGPKDCDCCEHPVLAISNRIEEWLANTHPLRIQSRILYTLTFVTHGAEDTAIQNGRTLVSRAKTTLIDIHQQISGLTSDSEKVTSLFFWHSEKNPEAGYVRQRKFPDSKESSKWFVAHDLSIVFYATTTGA